MLHAIFGAPENATAQPGKPAAPSLRKERPDSTPIKLTPDIFDHLFGNRGDKNA